MAPSGPARKAGPHVPCGDETIIGIIRRPEPGPGPRRRRALSGRPRNTEDAIRPALDTPDIQAHLCLAEPTP